MIILEGCDGAGKTTLARRLAEDLDLEIRMKVPGVVPSVPANQRVYEALGDAVEGRGGPDIHDRLFFSELVYGEVLRGRVGFNRVEIDYIMRVMKTLQCPIVFCTASMTTIKRNVEESQQLEGVHHNLRRIVESYRWLIQECARRRLNVMTFDYTEPTEGYRFIKRSVEEYLEYRRERTW